MNDSQGCLDDASFNNLALQVFEFQFTHNLPYRRFCEARKGAPSIVRHWTEIPAISTAAFKLGEYTCIHPSLHTRVFHSSGTTEHIPSRHFHFPNSLEVYEASLWPWFKRHVLLESNGDYARHPIELLCLTPSANQAPNSSLAYMFDAVRRKLGAPEDVFTGYITEPMGWAVNFDAALRKLQQCELEGTLLLILGTAFGFVHLLDEMERQGRTIHLPAGSRVLETGGYKGRSRVLPRAELHTLIQQRLGICPQHIICEYGMSELSSQAYARGFGEGRFRFPPWARCQIISPETGREVNEGQTGLIRVVDLANVFSVIAVQTEDLGIRRAERFALMGRAQTAEPRGCSRMAA